MMAFFGERPRPLATRNERNRLREALKRLTTTDLLLGSEIGAVLYVESETDERILSCWARILDHPAMRFFERPFVRWLRGRSLREAREHLFALGAAFPNIRGLCLLDGDNRDESDETTAAGLVVLRWRRYEIENYLMQPNAIGRFAFPENLPLLREQVDAAFREQVPREPISSAATWRSRGSRRARSFGSPESGVGGLQAPGSVGGRPSLRSEGVHLAHGRG